MTLYDYWLALYRNKAAILLVTASSALFALAFSLVLPPVYEAKASFYVPAPALPETGAQPGAPASTAPRLLPVADEKTAGVHLGILRSKDMARAVAAQFPGRDAESLGTDVDFVLGREFLIDIYARDRSPENAAAIANAYAQAYEQFHRRTVAQRSTHQSERLRMEIASIEALLLQSRRAQHEYQQGSDLVSASLERDKLSQLSASMEAEFNITQANLASARERIRKTEDLLRQEKGTYRESDVAVGNAHVDTLKQSIANLELRLANLKDGLADSHPKVRQAREELEQARKGLAAETKTIIGSRSQRPGSTYESLRQQLLEHRNNEQALEARGKALQASLAQARDANRASASKINALESLQQQTQNLQDFKLAAQRSLEDAKLNERLPAMTIVMAEQAVPPARPAFPRAPLNVIASLIVGLAAGCYYALFLDYLRRVRRERVRARMDLAPLEESLR